MKSNRGRVLILLNKDEPSGSETFIKNHIDYFNSKVVNINKFLPLEPKKTYSSFLSGIYTRYLLKRKRDIFLKNVRTFNPDVVLAEFGSVGAEGFKFFHKLGIPFVVHFHGQDAHSYQFIEKYGPKYREMFLAAKRIIVVSNHMKDAILKMSCPSEKVKLNIYGVNETLFRKIVPSQNPPLIISVGRFVDKKAPYLTLFAFKKVSMKFPDARLKMIGNGYLLESCIRLVKALEIENKVDFPGSINSLGVIEAMQTARIFVLHSVVAHDGDTEGTPNVILEAGSMGLPIVSTRHAGIPDVVVHEKTGFLVEEGDVEKMATYMVQLLDSPSLCDQVGNNAHQHIFANYKLSDSLQKLESILFE